MTQTLAQGIAQAMSADPETGAIEFYGRWYTWGELSSLMRSIEGLLAQAGVGGDAPLAMLLRNRPGMLAAALEGIRSGHTVVTINPYQAPDQLAVDIRAMRSAVVVADPQDWDHQPLREAVREIGALGISVRLDPDALRVEVLPGLDRLGPGPFQAPMPGVALLMLSSGTTGPAKRIELPARQLEQSIASAAAYEKKRSAAGDGMAAQRSPTVLSGSMVHIGGLYFALDAVVAGRPLALLEKFNVAEYVRVLKAYRPKALSLPPTAMRMLLDAAADPDAFASVKVVRGGSAPLTRELKEAFEARFRVPVLDVYGATEFAGAIAGWSLDDYRQFDKIKIGSVGRPQPGVRLRVVDASTGAELPPGTQGVLEVCARQVDPDRWIRTTDLAEIDSDGFLYIRGRADDAIIRGGFKVLPREIEAVLREHPAVQDAGVVGLKDERLGAVPVAAVELCPGAPAVTPEELLSWLRGRLVAYLVPTQVRIVAALPRTPSLKISQHEVRRLFTAA